jgi:hypothetical protein
MDAAAFVFYMPAVINRYYDGSLAPEDGIGMGLDSFLSRLTREAVTPDFKFRLSKNMLASLLTFLDILDTDGSDPKFEKIVKGLGVDYPQRPLYDHFMDAIYGDDLPRAESTAREMQAQGVIDLGDLSRKYPDSPLSEYIAWRRFEAVEILLRHGAMLNYENSGSTAVYDLIDSDDHTPESEMIRYLVLFSLYNINWEVRSINRWTALHLASCRGLLDVVKYLVEHGANINAQEDIDNYETPLQTAMFSKRYAVAKYLLDSGADPYVINCDGRHLMGGMGFKNVDALRAFIA